MAKDLPGERLGGGRVRGQQVRGALDRFRQGGRSGHEVRLTRIVRSLPSPSIEEEGLADGQKL
jgi:hypothetical protein